MAPVTAPAGVSAQHQKLLHFVANSTWSDEAVLAKVQEMVLPAVERHEPIVAWIVGDTSFPKQGKHSVGVHHQYCGQLGKQANLPGRGDTVGRQPSCEPADCVSAVSAGGMVEDAARSKKACIPEQVTFKTKRKRSNHPTWTGCQARLAA